MAQVLNPVFLHGKESEVMLNEFDLTCFLNTFDLTQDIDLPEVSTFCNDTRRFINGMRNATGSLGGFIDDDSADGIDAILQATFNVPTSSLWSDAPNGFGVGNLAYLFRALISSYSTSQPTDGVESFTADLQLDGDLTRGNSFHALAVETVTGFGSSVDNIVVSTATGAVAHLHVCATNDNGATLPSLDVFMEDSADDAAFAAITGFAFTQLTTTVGSERLETSTGTIRRYVHAAWTIGFGVGGPPDYTFVVTFGRKP